MIAAVVKGMMETGCVRSVTQQRVALYGGGCTAGTTSLPAGARTGDSARTDGLIASGQAGVYIHVSGGLRSLRLASIVIRAASGLGPCKIETGFLGRTPRALHLNLLQQQQTAHRTPQPLLQHERVLILYIKTPRNNPIASLDGPGEPEAPY